VRDKSAPTGFRGIFLKPIIGLYGWPEYFVNVHYWLIFVQLDIYLERNSSMAMWNNPTVTGVEKRAGNVLSGFRAFILRGNVVDLAVGIVIGAAFTAVVNGLVSDLITPLIPVTGGNLSNWTVKFGYVQLKTGAFINALISFLIVAFVIYFFVVQPVNALMARYKPKEVEVPPATRDCPYCLSSVPLMATRCAYCTSPLPPPNQTPATAQQRPGAPRT
jgi:large conductance mechanosensitive channel